MFQLDAMDPNQSSRPTGRYATLEEIDVTRFKLHVK